jgi:hypothetical protein
MAGLKGKGTQAPLLNVGDVFSLPAYFFHFWGDCRTGLLLNWRPLWCLCLRTFFIFGGIVGLGYC